MTREEVLEALEYRDGELVWKDYLGSGKSWNARRRGNTAGSDSGHGYLKVRLLGKNYYVHQLVYLMHHGHIPEVIDHIDHNSSNNKIENLRAADKSKNGMNRPAPRSNTSGAKGVVWHKGAQKWMGRIVANGKDIYLGVHKDFDDAVAAVTAARQQYHGDFAKA